MDIEKINEMWESDCKIDRNDLTTETLRTANLHQKYLQMLMQCKNKLIKFSSDLAVMKERKTRYYNGELSRDELTEYGYDQYQGLRPLKSDMPNKLEADADIIKIKLRMQYVENMIYQLESIMFTIKGRDWSIKNHITWLQFQSGN